MRPDLMPEHLEMLEFLWSQRESVLSAPDWTLGDLAELEERFDAHLDETGISLSLYRTGEVELRKSIRMHFRYALFAEILQDLAKTVASMPPSDAAHRDMLRDASKALYRALDPARNDKADLAGMTPEEEVLLLHVME
jgi:hypothetical protein